MRWRYAPRQLKMPSTGTQITPDSRGPIINIISWILLVLTCLATLTKIWSKWDLTKKLQADDYYLTGAMVRTTAEKRNDGGALTWSS